MTTRLLIVEDEGLFRDMLQASLRQRPDLEVLGCTGDGGSAVRMALDKKPHVVLMDIQLGDGINGIEAGLRIKKDRPETGIVLLSIHKEKEYIATIPLEEATGWSYKLNQSVSDLTTLTRAIEGAAAGLNVIDPALVKALKPRPLSVLDKLTPRQFDILTQIALSHNNSSIARELFLDEKSVENYISALYQQLQITRGDPVHPRVKATLIYLRETQTI